MTLTSKIINSVELLFSNGTIANISFLNAQYSLHMHNYPSRLRMMLGHNECIMVQAHSEKQ